MKKFGYVVAAILSLAVVAPTIANAETVVVKRGHHMDHRHSHPHHHKVVVIKHRH